MTEVTKNSRLFAVSSTTCSTLLAATHRHPGSTSPARPVSVPIRRPSDRSSVFTSFETGIYLYIAHTRYTHACGVWVVFLEYGGGAPGIFKSPVCTYNQSWTFVRFTLFFLPEQAWSEAPCIIYTGTLVHGRIVPGTRYLITHGPKM